jgi:death-on-curing protein
MSPQFLSVSDVLHIHQNQIARYGGASGMRDRELLASAIAQPFATFEGEFLHEDLFEMAAAYLFHIARNHPFVDGNKRTAVVSALVFLFWNGYKVIASNEAVYDLAIAVATDDSSKPSVVDFLRDHAVPLDAGDSPDC